MEPELAKISQSIVLPILEADLAGRLAEVASACDFEELKVYPDSRFAVASRRAPGGNTAVGSWSRKLALFLEWKPLGNEVAVNVAVYDSSIETAKVADVAVRQQVINALDHILRAEPADSSSEIILATGQRLRAAPRGPVRDYSHCAREQELDALFHGDLPLGRYAFGPTAKQVKHGQSLFLSRFPHTGQLMIYNGVLLCAPQNSGKTELLLQWAKAANSAGYSVLIVDVKGNVRDKLKRDGGTKKGEMFCFSTRPESESDRINFLAPLAHDQPLDSRRLEALAAAILPSEGWEGEGGEAELFYQSRLLRLTALIHILKFRHRYFSTSIAQRKAGAKQFDAYERILQRTRAIPTLAELYQLATDEDLLCFWIKEIRLAEASWRMKGRALPEKIVDDWARDIAPMIHPDALPGIGQRRDPKASYREFTYGVALALQPFSEGVLKQRTAPVGSGRLFEFPILNRHKDDPPITLLLEVGEDDPKQAAAIISLTVRALDPILHARMHSGPRAGTTVDDWQPLLLLLDETKRIRGFKPVDYITFARERRASCVLVYQSLNLIGPRTDIDTVLSNVGTQIYLGKLVGDTAEAFSRLLPAEDRRIYTVNETDGSVQSRWEPRPVLTPAELFRLPAGKWPALVHIHDLPDRKPFLVDLDHSVQVTDARPITAPSARQDVARTATTSEGLAPTDWAQQGTAFLQAAKFKEALECFDRALLERPDDIHVWGKRGLALLRLARWSELVENADRALRVQPEYAFAHTLRGAALLAMNRFSDALESLDRAVKIDAQDATAWHCRASALLQLKRPKEALASIDQSIALVSDDSDTHRIKGMTLILLERWPQALVTCDKAIELNSRDTQSWQCRSRALWNLTRYAEALSSADQALAINGRNAQAHYDRANALHRLERYDEAFTSIEAAVALEARDPEFWILRGKILGNLNKPEDCIRSADRALGLSANNVSAFKVKAGGLGRLGRHEEALVCLDEAARLGDAHAGIVANRVRQSLRQT